jgi:hypothetical protein
MKWESMTTAAVIGWRFRRPWRCHPAIGRKAWRRHDQLDKARGGHLCLQTPASRTDAAGPTVVTDRYLEELWTISGLAVRLYVELMRWRLLPADGKDGYVSSTYSDDEKLLNDQIAARTGDVEAIANSSNFFRKRFSWRL